MEMNVSRLYSKRVIMERLMQVKYSFRYRLIIILANVPPWHKFFCPKKSTKKNSLFRILGKLCCFVFRSWRNMRRQRWTLTKKSSAFTLTKRLATAERRFSLQYQTAYFPEINRLALLLFCLQR